MSQRLRQSKTTNFMLCGDCFKRLSLKTYKQHRRLYCHSGIWCNVSQFQKHNEDDSSSISLSDSSSDDSIKETDFCREKEQPYITLVNLMRCNSTYELCSDNQFVPIENILGIALYCTYTINDETIVSPF